MKIGREVHQGFDGVLVIYGGIIKTAIIAADSPSSTREILCARAGRVARFLGHHQGGCPFALSPITNAQIDEFLEFLLRDVQLFRVQLTSFGLDRVAVCWNMMLYTVRYVFRRKGWRGKRRVTIDELIKRVCLLVDEVDVGEA